MTATSLAATSPNDARQARFARLSARAFDVIVIGGGIVGAGVARDAAMRGLSVALLERDDFASGTSSRSSRLVHGGVRYLEYGYFHLVFEASRERRTLLRIAPHLVRPLAFTWPVYRGARVARWKLGAGLTLYDTLALWRNVARHRRLTPAGVMAREPSLNRADLVGGAMYYDAQTSDTRLTLATAQSAAASGAVVLNHAQVQSITHNAAGKASGVQVRDMLTNTEYRGSAQLIVNAAGPWGDRVRHLDEGVAPPAVRGTKGVHLTVPAARVGNHGAVTLLSVLDGRVMFVLPSGRHTIIGTTDTASDAGPDEVRANEADIAYLLESANAIFPAAQLQRSDVVSAWAGIRPLIASGNDGDPASASREHAIVSSPTGLMTVSGGKLTTYRAMAADVVNAVEHAIGRPHTLPTTDKKMLPGADRSAEVQRLARTNPAWAMPLVDGLPFVGAELVYAVQHEWACTLADLLIRRVPLAFEMRDAGVSVATRAAELVAPVVGWTPRDIQGQVDAYARDAARIFSIDP